MRFGPFWLETRVAVGGTAEVYLARSAEPEIAPADRRLVVKRLLPQFMADSEGVTMFEREAALHASVRHKNVVEVYASGVTEGEPWLAMEFVDGCDLYRLLRRVQGESNRLAPSVAVHVARDVLAGLASVHAARDDRGKPMSIIHRDVTPSNVYLSNDGAVKLGDFGIARSARATLRNAASAMLKGKFGYLSPEQVAGEPFDQRADLFSLAVVLAEMLIGRQLFSGGGQLAVLLAIRDCRIDALREARASMPKGLFEVIERGLSRDPARRFPTAAALSAALAPFDPAPDASRAELSALVRWAQSAPSQQVRAAQPTSSGSMRAAAPVAPPDEDEWRDSERTTGEYVSVPSLVETAGGQQMGPWSFARVVEAISTGEIGQGDRIDYMGRGLAPIERIDELSRFLPLQATTNRVHGVGAPDFSDEVAPRALLTVLLRVLETDGTGVLFAEGSSDPKAGRKEMYFAAGKLHHVVSNNASELLGEYLVRRGFISREELDFALAVLPRYAGRMGDTLISLGLVESLEVFRGIREQGRDRVVDLFRWPAGRLTYYAGQTAPQADFPLDLELPPLLFAGLEAAQPGEIPVRAYAGRLDALIGPATTIRPRLREVRWPPVVRHLFEATDEPRTLREVLSVVTRATGKTEGDVLRALEILLAGRLISWR